MNIKSLFTQKASISESRVSGNFIPETVNKEARTVEVVFTTGQSGERYDWYNDTAYLEELEVTPNAVRTERLDKGLSVIDNHNTYKGIDGVFGITEDYRFEDGKLIGTVRFATDEDSDKKFSKVSDGILRHVSLGYKVHKFQKLRGQDGELDTYRAIDWQPTELSFTPVSFETNNGVRAEQRKLNDVEIEDYTMNKVQLARLRALQGLNARSVDEDRELIELLTMQSRTAPVVAEPVVAPAPVVAPDPVVAPAPVVPEPVVNLTDVRSQERSQLKLMVDAAKSSGLKIEFANRAFDENKSIEDFRTMCIAELGKDSSKETISLKTDNRSDHKESIRSNAQSALIYRMGGDVELTPEIRDFSGLSLFEMARDFVDASGVATRGMSRHKVASRAFHSTSDFPLILENVINKNLQAAYIETPQTFRDLGRRTTVNDFREKHTYTLGDAPSLQPLNENGEYKAGTFSEGKEKYSIATFASKIAFTRKMLINDDMSALDRMPSMYGAAGSRLESDIVWGLLLGYDFFKNIPAVHLMNDGIALYDATHGNLLSGAGSDFSVASISALRKLGRKAKTLDGNFMNITYQDLVIPEDIETTVEQILTQNFTAITSNTTNPFQNKLQFRVEPRLSQVSQSAWYAFSKQYESFEYAYLAGEQEMMTEVNQSTDVDGLEIKVRKDFGAGFVDYRGTAKSTGQA